MSIIEKHTIVDLEFVECKICGKKSEKIDNRHLKSHKITFDVYRKQFPNEPTMTKQKLKKELDGIEKRKESISKIKDKLKKVPCYFHQDRTIIVGVYEPKYGLCDECKILKRILPSQEKAVTNMRKTIKERYGVDNASKLDLVNKKRKIKDFLKTKEEKDAVVKKREQTMIETIGEDWAKVNNKKSKQGMLEKYGVEHPLQNPEFVEKANLTKSKRTDQEKSESNRKTKETKLKKHGDPNFNNVEKRRKTTFEKRGVFHHFQDPEVIKVRDEKRNKKISERIYIFLEIIKLKLLDEKYENCYYHHNFKCLNCDFEFKQTWNAIQQGFICPNCRPKSVGSSQPEKDLQEYIKAFNFQNISFGNRTLISPWELDIVIHDLKIAIEYNGFYFHNDEIIKDTRKKLKDSKQYHSMKRLLCLEKGYRLITIFEDEWIFNKNIVIGRLNQILGKVSNRIHGRECIIKEIPPHIKNQFLEKYHIQGKDSSTIKLGAFYNDELVSVMTFSKGNVSKGSSNQESVWELNRFCINYVYHIPGIASKLLEHFKRNYTWKEIYSYADLRWSTGNLYRQLGFNCDEKIRLNYWYLDINKIKRIHRFALRKKSDEPKDIPEYVLRISEGYKIIWDCGNLKFIMINN